MASSVHFLRTLSPTLVLELAAILLGHMCNILECLLAQCRRFYAKFFAGSLLDEHTLLTRKTEAKEQGVS